MEDYKKQWGDRGKQKQADIAKAKEIPGKGKWSLLEELCQEIEAKFIIEKRNLSISNQIKLLRSEIELRYAQDNEICTTLLAAVPSNKTMEKWRNKKGWEEAVWEIIRGEGLFTAARRAKVIDELFNSAVKHGNIQAAKMFLTLSGDYVEKGDSKSSESIDIFRELNDAIHSKSK